MIEKGRKGIVSFVWLLWVVVLCSSCALRARPSEEETTSLNNISEVIKVRCLKWENFEARLKLKVANEGKVSRFLLHVWKYGKKTKIDVVSLWGQTIAVGIIGEGRSFIWFVGDRRLYISDSPERLSKLLVGISMNPDELMGCVTGCFPVFRKDFGVVSSVEAEGHMDISEIHFGRLQKILVKYDHPFKLSKLDEVPSKVFVTAGKSSIIVTIPLIKPLTSPPPKVFDVNPPSYVEKYYL